MKRILTGAVLAFACASAAIAQAQSTAPAGALPADTMNRLGGARVAPQATARPPRAYAETTLSLAAGVWTPVFAGSPTAQKVILSDTAGLGCAWSLNPAPAAGEGVTFSAAATPGFYVFDDPVPTNALYVACQAAGVLTVVTA